uniref:HDC07068 n=1 Tax=Drosophila melanogaster TaxID=7227 RepID=Q6IG79_DROME|nr:TPA_inf: HDC07068 [Drosophila melanogaster]
MEKMAGSSRRESANEVNDRPNCPAESKLQVRLCLCLHALRFAISDCTMKAYRRGNVPVNRTIKSSSIPKTLKDINP